MSTVTASKGSVSRDKESKQDAAAGGDPGLAPPTRVPISSSSAATPQQTAPNNNGNAAASSSSSSSNAPNDESNNNNNNAVLPTSSRSKYKTYILSSGVFEVEQRYEIREVIGQGAYGVVWSVNVECSISSDPPLGE
jgi:hypothetical protein